MKLLLIVLCLFLGAATPGQAGDFTKTMTPDEQAQAGLAKLTPEELVRLKAVVERYKSGEVDDVRQEAEKKVAAAEAKAKHAAVAVAPATMAEGKKPNWFAALVTLRKTADKPDKAEALEGRLAGSLKTFNGRRSFELQDGQVWRMIESGRYSGPTLEAPAVSITPGFMGIYWLQIREAPLLVKVQPVKID
jgi:hypothetical protein